MFYDTYKRLCDEHNEKPFQLAVKLGMKSNSAVAQWQKGSLPRPAMMQKIAAYFGVPVSYLLSDGDDKDPAPAESQSGITGKEWELVRLFRVLPEDLQSDVLAQLRGVLERRGLLPKQS